MTEGHVFFPCRDLSLEGAWCPPPQGSGPFPVVILCHPHPLYGGDMDNNAILALELALTRSSFISFRFNFRGAGQSQGRHDNGRGEAQDILAALDFALSQPAADPDRIYLAGYSFGAMVALPVALKEPRFKALALISPPPVKLPSQAPNHTLPKLIVSGDEDFIVPPEAVRQLYETLAEPKELELLANANHFWFVGAAEMAERVASFLLRID